jgi:uncharacterized membrane-anchored protein
MVPLLSIVWYCVLYLWIALFEMFLLSYKHNMYLKPFSFLENLKILGNKFNVCRKKRIQSTMAPLLGIVWH